MGAVDTSWLAIATCCHGLASAWPAYVKTEKSCLVRLVVALYGSAFCSIHGSEWINIVVANNGRMDVYQRLSMYCEDLCCSWSMMTKN